MATKKELSERDIITKFIIPAIEKSKWNKQTQIREEFSFTNGRIFVKGKKTKRGERKRADIILYYKPNIPVAVLRIKSLEAFEKAADGQATKIIIPSDIQNMAGLAAGIKEVLTK